ncbi:MAG: glutamate--tRNA ligase, partial [Actinomycetota bacterium]|nr:glutamate--tRNA ligase [Actinomycetota bacterium]
MSLPEVEERYPPRELPAGAEVTRLAPSPTGRPHIGTALQALLNASLARKTGGLFLLRIEDTDQERVDERALDEIMAALDWLGEVPDEGQRQSGAYGPYVQSERLPLYALAARHLVESGGAYRCFCTPERLAELREQQRQAGQPTMYDRRCRSLDRAEAERRAQDEPHVVRMAVPQGEEVVLDDPARGPIAFDTSTLDDSVLLKADGFPTYHLAVVVDDHFMRITTVVRGEEWIPSTPKHLLLYRSFGWEPPRFFHTPVLRDEQRRKLSKRRGDTSLLGYFDRQGYLPEGLRNFMTRLLWAHPEEKDVYPHDDFLAAFDLAQLSSAGPVVEFHLLSHINGHHLRRMSPVQRFDRTAGYLARLLASEEPGVGLVEHTKGGGTEVTHVDREAIERFRAAFLRDPRQTMQALSLEPERFRTLGDVLRQGLRFFPETFEPAPAEELARPLGDPATARELLEAQR